MLDAAKQLLLGDLPRLSADPLGIFSGCVRDKAVTPLRIGPRRAFLVGDSALVRHVLVQNNTNYDKRTPAFRSVSVVLGNGLLTSNGELWKRQRRIAQPSFHADKLAPLAPVFSRLAGECAERWDLAAQRGEPVDACADMMTTTLKGVAECLFGADLSGSAGRIYDLFPVILNELAGRVTGGIALPLWIPTPGNRRLGAALREFRNVVDGMIALQRERLQGNRDGTTGRDLLSALMTARDEETGASMSDRQLRDEVMTILIAGHETTANALSWVWYLLDRHPGEQEAVRAEIDSVTGGRPPSMEDLPRLKRLRMVILETLRLYPPVWMIDRRALGPDTLGEHRVAAGDLVIISPYAIHRKPDLWPDPEAFRPDRFEPGREEQKDKHAYLPFGTGPRVCMGMGFAMIEAQILLGTLLSLFRVRLASPAPILPRPIVTLRPSTPVMLDLARVSKSATTP